MQSHRRLAVFTDKHSGFTYSGEKAVNRFGLLRVFDSDRVEVVSEPDSRACSVTAMAKLDISLQ